MVSQNNMGDSSHKRLALTEEEREMALYGRQPAAMYDEAEEEGIDIMEYWRIVMRHKFTVLLMVVIALVGTAIYTSMQIPIYRSTVKIQIDSLSNQVTDYEGTSGEDYFRAWDYLATQYELLKSKKLAKRVIKELGLTSSKQFVGEEKASFFKDLKQWVSGLFSVEKTTEPGTESPDGSKGLENKLLGGLTVNPVEGSRIVDISFNSPNPKLAARILNTLAESYISMSLERRFEASSYAKTFLEERLKQVRANLEDSEQALIEYAGDREIIDFEDKQGGLLDKLKVLNAKLVEVETQRIQAQSVYNEMQATGVYGVSRVTDNETIQTYKQSLAALESEYQEKLHTYKPAYPSMQQLSANIEELKKRITEEVNNIQSGAKSEYRASVREEAMLKAEISDLKKEILTAQAGSTEFQVLMREVETNRELYDGLLQRVKEVNVTAGIGSNNISIVDEAEVSGAPFTPNLKKNLMLALVLGTFGGIGLAFLFDHLDDTVKSSTDMEKMTGLSVLGIIPEVDLERENADTVAQLTLLNPTSAIAEAFRSLRTALSFSTTSGSPDVLHLTSTSAGEGKTTAAVSLATVYAQAGSNVLMIDGDLRNPSLHKELNISNEAGLTNYLAGGTKPSQVIQSTDIRKIWCLPSGPIPPNPVELLASARMVDLVTAASKKFNLVILDSPPVLGLADALVLANMAKAVLVVVDGGRARKGPLSGALQRLSHARANVLGTILTKYREGGSGYGYDYNYNYSYYSYGADDEADDESRKSLV